MDIERSGVEAPVLLGWLFRRAKAFALPPERQKGKGKAKGKGKRQRQNAGVLRSAQMG
jgi:hypothetical protein